MKKKIFTVMIIMLLLSIMLPVPASTLDEETPVLIDRKWDVRFLFIFPLIPQNMFCNIDILSVSFSEDEYQPELLFVTLELRDLSITLPDFDAGYTISWSFFNANYILVAHALPQGEKTFAVGSTTQSSNNFENWQTCTGFFDSIEHTIIFSVSKNSIGNPQQFSKLDNIDATAFLRPYDQETHQPGADIFKDFTHNAKQVSSYTIKY